MTSGPPPRIDDGRIGPGTILAAVLLVLLVAGAIWYFNASGGGGDFADVSVTTPSGDPGTETTILP